MRTLVKSFSFSMIIVKGKAYFFVLCINKVVIKRAVSVVASRAALGWGLNQLTIIDYIFANSTLITVNDVYSVECKFCSTIATSHMGSDYSKCLGY